MLELERLWRANHYERQLDVEMRALRRDPVYATLATERDLFRDSAYDLKGQLAQEMRANLSESYAAAQNVGKYASARRAYSKQVVENLQGAYRKFDKALSDATEDVSARAERAS